MCVYFSCFRNGIISDESLKCRAPIRSDIQSSEDHQFSLSSSPRNLGEPNEYVTLALAAEAERVRLLELVALFNQRLDKERNESDTLAVRCKSIKNILTISFMKERNIENLHNTTRIFQPLIY